MRCNTIGTTIGPWTTDRLLRFVVCFAALGLFGAAPSVLAQGPEKAKPLPRTIQLLDAQKLLEAQTFWDNRDWDWYRQQIPFFECPDIDIQTTYYYRWELLTKHLTYGSPNSGYSFTEFIDRPFWSGAYGAISCPAGHQIYEARWLKSPQVARDYSRYWFHTPGAQPRNYSTWLADATWALHLVHPDQKLLSGLLDDLVKNYEGWEQRHFVRDVGLFWQTGHDDGMEFNINSRQTQDILRGAPGFRPSFNAYMWADARAIAQIARLSEKADVARQYEQKAEKLKARMQELLWDERRQFFLQAYKQDEERDGHKIKALSKTYETGKFAGNEHGRELIGYVPWQFNLPDADRGYEKSWKFLMDRDYFRANFGPTTVERHDPMFLLQKSCCWWSGQSWPYATSQTLKAMANFLQNYQQQVVTAADYVELLRTFARSHRKEGQPYLAEACHPDTGSFEGHDGYNHSEHYFHSSYCDLVITGLVGLKPRDDDQVEIVSLAPPDWDYFALDDVPYHGRRLGIAWDRRGDRYGLGKGLHLLVDGRKVASQESLRPWLVSLPPRTTDQNPIPAQASPGVPTDGDMVLVNYAVNNDGWYYPRIHASYSSPQFAISKVNDGNYWYHRHPPNRWTTEGSPNHRDSLEVDLGISRPIQMIKLYPLDDGDGKVVTPTAYEVEYWDGTKWLAIPSQQRMPQSVTGHRANTVTFPQLETSRVRVTLAHQVGAASGLSEIELWGPARLPVAPAPTPQGNLAFNPGNRPFPKASASHTSRFDKVEMVNDGVTNFGPNPHNRWTSYESNESSDWLEVDFGAMQRVGRIELAIYDDRGGVQTPQTVAVQIWSDGQWRDVADVRQAPERLTGGQWNELRFAPVATTKVRVVFQHRGMARSGLSEILVWEK